jgi:hypothetical protein
LGVVAFWTCIVNAARRYPGDYDWRYLTLSQLIYPDRNPLGHVWASAALAACALCGLLWLHRVHPAPTAGRRVLTAGYGCMLGSSLLAERLVSWPHGHEFLAIAAFLLLSVGLPVVGLRQGSWGRGGRVLLIAGAYLPLIAVAGTQLYLSLARPDVPWVGLAWRDRGIPI